MKTWTVMSLAVGLMAVVAVAEEAQPSKAASLTAEIKIGTGIENREPIGVADSFGSETEQLVGWTYIKGATEPVEVKHVWIFEGQEMGAIPLQVKSSTYRTWSRKSVQGKSGKWTFELRDSAGQVVASKSFNVGSATPAAPAAPVTQGSPATPK